MKRKIFVVLIIFILVYFLGFFSNRLINQRNESPLFIDCSYDDNERIKSFLFSDNNGLLITVNYNLDSMQTINIYDEKNNYQQSTVFGKTYDGAIQKTTPPNDGEIIEIDSFLSRSEIINKKELRYYITDSENPEIIIDEFTN